MKKLKCPRTLNFERSLRLSSRVVRYGSVKVCYGNISLCYGNTHVCYGNKQVCYGNTPVRYDRKCLVTGGLVLAVLLRAVSYDSTQACNSGTAVSCIQLDTVSCGGTPVRCSSIGNE